jgi:hypothetical protein
MAAARKPKGDQAAAAAPTAEELAELAAAMLATAMEQFRSATRQALLAGVPGNELRDAVVAVFDEVDGLRVAARDRDENESYPKVRM